MLRFQSSTCYFKCCRDQEECEAGRVQDSRHEFRELSAEQRPDEPANMAWNFHGRHRTPCMRQSCMFCSKYPVGKGSLVLTARKFIFFEEERGVRGAYHSYQVPCSYVSTLFAPRYSSQYNMRVKGFPHGCEMLCTGQVKNWAASGDINGEVCASTYLHSLDR